MTPGCGNGGPTLGIAACLIVAAAALAAALLAITC